MSEYTPTNWQSGDIATAARFNKLEQGVGAMSAGYTPHVWQDGDVPTAAQMNALEQAVAAGGGGSSDFSTATVTFTNIEGTYFSLPCIMDEDGVSGISCAGITESGTYTIPLYTGLCAGGYDTTSTVTVTGDIQDVGGFLLITGDGTITLS